MEQKLSREELIDLVETIMSVPPARKLYCSY